jgi:hypothetical protein
MHTNEQPVATHRKAWATPHCEALLLAHTAGGPPGGADGQASNSTPGCNPKAGCS